jgi:hypothetical protein
MVRCDECRWWVRAFENRLCCNLLGLRLLVGMFLLLCFCARAFAHSGPPFPIMENRAVGPVMVTIWANPDVGTGSFFVLVSPLPGRAIPEDLKVRIAVQPVSKRLPEAGYNAWREHLRGQVEYKVVIPFDQQEKWRIRLLLTSSQGNGEATTDVDVTPPGFGQWDLLLFSLPFLGVGVLWFKAISVKRSRRKTRVQRAV